MNRRTFLVLLLTLVLACSGTLCAPCVALAEDMPAGLPAGAVPEDALPDANDPDTHCNEANAFDAPAPEADAPEAETPAEHEGVKIATITDALDASRYIDIYAIFEGDSLHAGVVVTLAASLHGYENLVYTLQWEMSDGGDWVPVGQLNAVTYSFRLTEALYNASWRIVVNITEAKVVQ
ncbi:MAG: hypothetical protein MR400_10105 [Clostridiales bacterium]|nr:hypothetical protein [Clostridiales bacterium]